MNEGRAGGCAQARKFAVTFICPGGEQERIVEASTKEQARRALHKIVPNAHVIHVEAVAA